MKIIKKFKSKDKKTIKFLQETFDNHIIETGYYNLDEHILCLSTQIGCAMGCIFCATANPDDLNKKAFIRDLSSEEIIFQAENILKTIDINTLNKKRILFSFMGMGEPLLNYDNLVESIKVLSINYPKSRTTVSTTGVRPDLMKKIAEEEIDTVFKMHLSLHAPEIILRKNIMPGTGSIVDSLDSLMYFSQKRGTEAKVNYMMIHGVNDSSENLNQLINLLKKYPFTIKISNLNNFNDLKSSPLEKFEIFENTLIKEGLKTSRFFSNGTDIKAGCGQLKRHFFKK